MIKLENVSKKYGNFYAVKKLNFEVKEGEIVGFLGRNGAGKSTTMNMITGFIEPTEGTITIGGYDIDYEPKKAKALIGYMPEGVPLYSDLTVREFVAYMADLKLVRRAERKSAVQKAILDTGLDKVQNKLIRNLSRGFKQRVSLAGAIVGEPKILILDEPTVGLDPEQVVEIRELIKSFRKNHTVILSSHILSEVSQICEKVIIIDKGEIIAVDTPEHLENNTNKDEDIQISLTVEDPESKFESLKEKISNIKEMLLKEELDDGSKKYAILVNGNNDIRKDISIECSKLNIIILEMKKEEKTLEDAFIKLVEDRPELTQKEREEIDKEMELNDLRNEAKLKKEKNKNSEENTDDNTDDNTETKVADNVETKVNENDLEKEDKNNLNENKEEIKDKELENNETEEKEDKKGEEE